MSRWKAASIHLSISIFVGLLVIALLFLAWYPQPYFEAAGGQHLAILLLGVDLVLGPMLTLILFKSGKKGMAFDLWMIGIVQASALVYGLHVIAEARPVFIVAAVDRFNVVAAADLDPEDLALGSRPEFRTLSWTGPRIIAAHLPPPGRERSKLIFAGPMGKDIQVLPKYYVDYTDEAAGILTRAKPLEKLRKKNPASKVTIDGWLEKHGRSDSDTVFVPLLARKASLTMLLDSQSGEVLDALSINPW